MSKTIDQLSEIILAGGIIKVDIKSRPYSHILKLVEKASLGKGGVIFQNSELRTTKQLLELSSYNSHNNIHFEIN